MVCCRPVIVAKRDKPVRVKTYNPIGGTMPLTIPFQPKAIQELWDPFGRMNATLRVEFPFTTNLNQTTIPMGYAEPTTENIIDGQPQIWKITHNGVDTHPVHFHMMNVQLINRVGWANGSVWALGTSATMASSSGFITPPQWQASAPGPRQRRSP